MHHVALTIAQIIKMKSGGSARSADSGGWNACLCGFHPICFFGRKGINKYIRRYACRNTLKKCRARRSSIRVILSQNLVSAEVTCQIGSPSVS